MINDLIYFYICHRYCLVPTYHLYNLQPAMRKQTYIYPHIVKKAYEVFAIQTYRIRNRTTNCPCYKCEWKNLKCPYHIPYMYSLCGCLVHHQKLLQVLHRTDSVQAAFIRFTFSASMRCVHCDDIHLNFIRKLKFLPSSRGGKGVLMGKRGIIFMFRHHFRF